MTIRNNNKRYKFGKKSYWKSTPKFMRKLGDSFLGIFSITSVSSMIMDNKELAIISLIIGVVGKVLTNFFTENCDYQDPNEYPYRNTTTKDPNDEPGQGD